MYILNIIKRSMFDSYIPNTVDTDEVKEPESKRKKTVKPCDSKLIHPSLSYTSIIAPPLVAYKSLNSYCEKNRADSLAADCATPSMSGLNDVQSVSNPIVLRTPTAKRVKRALPEGAMPYTLFTIEELAQVKCLKNWMSTKVCAVGQISCDTRTQVYYLNSACESGQWSLMLDISALKEIPKLQQLLQIYGTLTIRDVQSCLEVFFTRNLSWVNLPLFIEGYSLMQTQVGILECKNVQDRVVSPQTIIVESQMNDTLDDYSFSSIL